MATTYSLICWGGRTGKTVTMTVASPCVVTSSNHGLRNGTGIVFTTTGALPTGITVGTTYYAYSTGANTFNLYDTQANALAGGTTGRINTSGTQSGTHTCFSAFWYNANTNLSPYGVDKTRYGTSGNERVYAGVSAASSALNTILNTAPDYNGDYVIEFAEAFDEINSGVTALQLTCGTTTLISKINGIRTPAWHGGNPANGFRMTQPIAQPTLSLNSYYATVDGLNFIATGNSGVALTTGSLACFAIVSGCIAQGNTAATSQKIFTCSAPGEYYNNLIINAGGNGLDIQQYSGIGSKYYNNIITKCTGFGVTQDGATQGLTYNNISVGNGTNWGSWPTYVPAPRHFNNYGEPSDKKTITVNYSVNANNITLTGHGRATQLPIIFTTTGVLPTVVTTGQPLVSGKIYFVRTVVDTNTFTISATPGGTVLAFLDNGSGTHYTTAIWSNDGSEKYIDISTPGNVFRDYANNDFYPANTSAPQVDTGVSVYKGNAVDLLGAVRPNYNLGVTENWDGGPYEFDHGHGLAPVGLTIYGFVTGSDVVVYASSNGSVLQTFDAVTGTSCVYNYSTLQNIDIGVFLPGKIPKYLRNYTLTGVAVSVPISQDNDRNYAA